MQHKVIFVLLDGLCLQVAQECMGSLGALIEDGQGAAYALRSELPSLSRPLYECLLTGSKPVKSGIIHNQTVRRSTELSVFELAAAQGRVTAASAYHWISELYNHAPFDPVSDRIIHNEKAAIQHAVFYQWDDYPDEAVIYDAEMLRRRYNPDLLFIHPMNIDDVGHHYGADSSEYRNVVRRDDIYLSYFMGQWLKEGWQVVITADHGMNHDGTHGGMLPIERDVPLMVFGSAFGPFNPDVSLKQTEICGLICELLGLKHDKPFAQGVLHA